MSIDRVVMAFAGVVILATIAIVMMGGSTNWLYLTGFVGLNLFQAAFTGFCPLAIILKKMGIKPGEAFS